MREAAELAQTDPKAAVAAYDKIAADGAVGPVLQDLAALRAGALLIDAGAFDEARRRLEPLAAEDRTFRHTARELLVLAAWRAGDAAAAKRWFDMITTDAQTPAATRSRVEMLMALGRGREQELRGARMNRFARITLTASALSLGLVLAGCDSFDPTSFDPTSLFDPEIFNTKKKLPGERTAGVSGGHAGRAAGRAAGIGQGLSAARSRETAQAASAEAKPGAKPQAEAETQGRSRRSWPSRRRNRLRPPITVRHRPASQAAKPAAAPDPEPDGLIRRRRSRLPAQPPRHGPRLRRVGRRRLARSARAALIALLAGAGHRAASTTRGCRS